MSDNPNVAGTETVLDGRPAGRVAFSVTSHRPPYLTRTCPKVKLALT